ncbi:MAG TPA: DJ-1/PfpI family protein [Blastocatellia bacterium]|jgi:putative intracellular protease/amidase|nr:DJ-1/PfpI family protein [Blastocatellia bacterium]
MRKKAYLLVFDGLADWETALALCEINKKDDIDVITVGPSMEPVTTMGGVKIIPDAVIEDVDARRACIFIAPGGDMWEQEADERIISLFGRLHGEGVTIGAVCGATLGLGRAGLLNNTYHTSNSLPYLKEMLPDYKGEGFYVEALAVTDKDIITASGVGSVEFAREVIKRLGLYDEKDAEVWWSLFKHGVWLQQTGQQAGTD